MKLLLSILAISAFTGAQALAQGSAPDGPTQARASNHFRL
jgi:hypothetical protein